LNRKFGYQAEKLLQHGPESFLERCRSAFASGEYQLVIWAAASSRELPLYCKREVFGDVHMTMHQNTADFIKLQKEASALRKKIEHKQQACKKLTQDRRRLDRENKELKQDHFEIKARLRHLELEKEISLRETQAKDAGKQFDQLEEDNRNLRGQVTDLQARLDAELRKMDSLRKKHDKLSKQLEDQQALTARVENETNEILGEYAAMNQCNASCPSFDLCRKRILMVGGMSKMEALYREIIESRGGVFDYHNGYMKNGARQLESRLKRADIVLCPVNCNSHNACSLVKKMAKKYKKSIHMLESSSLSAVSQIIQKAVPDEAAEQ
jgi:chromosome segregation ATPase